MGGPEWIIVFSPALNAGKIPVFSLIHFSLTSQRKSHSHVRRLMTVKHVSSISGFWFDHMNLLLYVSPSHFNSLHVA